MKKVIYALILPLVVVSGLVFADRAIKNETSKKLFSIADEKARREAMKKWETSPDGKEFRKWEASAEGKKVQASVDKIRKNIETFTNMEAVVTDLSIPSPANGGSSGLKGAMVRINGETYILKFWSEPVNPNFPWFNYTFPSFNNDYPQLNSLKVNDKIIIRSRNIGRSANYPYLIISGDYVEQNGKIIFKREVQKGGGC
ncbi:MAG: hypothetical protein V4560_06595 [Bacteroidota bacterium]